MTNKTLNSPGQSTTKITQPSNQASTNIPAIEIDHLTKAYGSNNVLKDINLTIPAGMVYGILGPNGAGKTTLVRILATLLRHDSGSARIAGVNLAENPAGVRAKIGLVGQYAAVDEILTGRQNLEMFGRLYHLGATEARTRAGELLEQFDLTDASDKPVSQYSGGMRRRLDLAAGLLLRPEIIFLDEPTTGLDPRGRTEVWESVRALAAAGTTVLLTTQYLDEADQLCGRLCLIDNGQVITEGTPDQLKAHIGGDRLDIIVTDSARLTQAAQIVAPYSGNQTSGSPLTTDGENVHVDQDLRLISLPVHDRMVALDAVMSALNTASIEIDDISIRRPTLDEVFLHLTGTNRGTDR